MCKGFHELDIDIGCEQTPHVHVHLGEGYRFKSIYKQFAAASRRNTGATEK